MRYCRFYYDKSGPVFSFHSCNEVFELCPINPEWTDFISLVRAAGKLGLTADEMVRMALREEHKSMKIPYEALQNPPQTDPIYMLPPLDPPEAWGAGVTYKKSALERDADAAQLGGIYERVYFNPRPELFFKATPERIIGHLGDAGIRPDSTLTMPEPELAVIVDSDGTILGYTIADDVSAWDIERINPLYLPQSKIFPGCLVIGPFIATPEDVPHPDNLKINMSIVRNGKETFRGEANSGDMRRTISELVESLMACGPIPAGTLLCTGTGIMAPNECALRPGDMVSIEIEKIGTLIHGCKQL